MRTIPDQLKSRNLVPFTKRPGRYKIPGLASEQEALIERVDADLSPEEEGFIRHYLGYADTLLQGTEYFMPLEGPAAQDERKDEPAQANGNPNSKAA